jgi:hypothetical protein
MLGEENRLAGRGGTCLERPAGRLAFCSNGNIVVACKGWPLLEGCLSHRWSRCLQPGGGHFTMESKLLVRGPIWGDDGEGKRPASSP